MAKYTRDVPQKRQIEIQLALDEVRFILHLMQDQHPVAEEKFRGLLSMVEKTDLIEEFQKAYRG